MDDLSAPDALRLGRAILPSWVEHRGCVIREEQFDAASFEAWWRSTGGTRSATESVINHLHLWDLLPNTDETDHAELWQLGELMVLGWQLTLARDVPGRSFEVTLTDDYGPTVTAVSSDAP